MKLDGIEPQLALFGHCQARELGHRFAMARNNDLFALDCSVDQLGQVRLGLVQLQSLYASSLNVLVRLCQNYATRLSPLTLRTSFDNKWFK